MRIRSPSAPSERDRSHDVPKRTLGRLGEGERLTERYRIVRRLGSGGMGEVYEIEHEELGLHLAAKLLRDERAEDPQTVERFRREARAMARIRSDHVTRIIDSGTLPTGEPFLVMELLEGTDLKRLLASTGPLPVCRAVNLAIDACWGLRAVHRAGLVHRDIKPANLFVVHRDSGEDRCKLLDFGVAKSATTAQTATGELVGTLRYMAPEQLADRDLDERTDVYALGAVLYECLAGTPPHEGDTLERVLFSIMNRDPAPVSALRPHLPGGLEAIVACALARDPAERFASAASFAEALLPYANLASSEAFDDTCTTGTTLPRQLHRRQRPLPWLGAIIASGVLGWWLATWSSAAPHPSAAAPPTLTAVEDRKPSSPLVPTFVSPSHSTPTAASAATVHPPPADTPPREAPRAMLASPASPPHVPHPSSAAPVRVGRRTPPATGPQDHGATVTAPSAGPQLLKIGTQPGAPVVDPENPYQ